MVRHGPNDGFAISGADNPQLGRGSADQFVAGIATGLAEGVVDFKEPSFVDRCDGHRDAGRLEGGLELDFGGLRIALDRSNALALQTCHRLRSSPQTAANVRPIATTIATTNRTTLSQMCPRSSRLK